MPLAARLPKLGRAGLAAMVAVLVLPLVANTQSDPSKGAGLRVTPPRIETTIQPGQSKTVNVKVQNISDHRLTLKTNVYDFEPRDESGNPRLITDPKADPSAYSLRGFIGELDDLTLGAGKQATVPVELNVPDDQGPGSYYGAVSFTVTASGRETNNLSFTAGVGSLVLVQVPGDVNERLELREFGVLYNAEGTHTGSVFEDPPGAAVLRLENNGNVFVKPTGKITVKDWSGKVVGESRVNAGKSPSNVLPGSIRRLTTPISGLGRFGRYTVEAELAYGEDGRLSAKSTFWVIPWKRSLLVLAVLTLAVFAAARGWKHRTRRVSKRRRR